MIYPSDYRQSFREEKLGANGERLVLTRLAKTGIPGVYAPVYSIHPDDVKKPEIKKRGNDYFFGVIFAARMKLGRMPVQGMFVGLPGDHQDLESKGFIRYVPSKNIELWNSKLDCSVVPLELTRIMDKRLVHKIYYNL